VGESFLPGEVVAVLCDVEALQLADRSATVSRSGDGCAAAKATVGVRVVGGDVAARNVSVSVPGAELRHPCQPAGPLLIGDVPHEAECIQRCDLAGAQCGDLRQAGPALRSALCSPVCRPLHLWHPGHQGYVREIQKIRARRRKCFSWTPYRVIDLLPGES